MTGVIEMSALLVMDAISGFGDMFVQMLVAIGHFISVMGKYVFPINFVFGIIILFFERRNPASLWAWLLLLFFIPGIGFIVYLFMGQDLRRKKRFQIKEVEDSMSSFVHHQEKAIAKRNNDVDPDYVRYLDMVNLHLRSNKSLLVANNDIDIYSWGQDKFAQMKKDMMNAKEYIHLEYYIIEGDHVAMEIFDILKKKAAEGVEIRILYDGMGGRHVKKKTWKELESLGVKLGEFYPPFMPFFNIRINYRNHRKICVIDGDIGYIGGANIGKEYISEGKLGTWRDTHLRITGDAAVQLQLRFLLDWDYITKEKISIREKYYTPASIFEEKKTFGDKAIQIVSSGPDSKFQNIRNGYLKMITEAEHRIYIQSPYLVLDDALLETLKIAALSGIDVRVMMPCQPDHPFIYWASYSYAGELIKAGVKVYTYDDGFIHSKVMTVDGLVSSVGTANMDIRSFKVNFEINAFIYNKETTVELEKIFEEDMKNCTELTPERYASRSLLIRIKESISRLMAPIL